VAAKLGELAQVHPDLVDQPPDGLGGLGGQDAHEAGVAEAALPRPERVALEVALLV